MKRFQIITSLLTLSLLVGCEQEIAELKPQEAPTGESGTADFTKFVSVGNSLTAGFQAGALFNEGQANSFPSIMAKQFAFVSENDPFDQPDINSVNGYNSTSSTALGYAVGRLILFDPDGTGPRTPSPAAAGTQELNRTCPSPLTTPAVPAPYNTAEPPGAFAGNKANLNNFGVPGILLGQALTPLTGGPPTSNLAFNPLYARFASNPGTSTILGDALATSPTFMSFWLGNNDVLGYATTGGSGAIALTPLANFQGQYTTAINTILAANDNIKLVVATIPDVSTIPFFTTVRWNGIPLDAATATALNGGFAGFNQVLTTIQGNPGLLTNFNLTTQDLERRKVTYEAGTNNKALISDKTLTDLGNVFDFLEANSLITPTQRAQLAPLEQVRPASDKDLLTLSAGSILGTCVSGNAQLINGLSVPLADQFVLLETEITEIKNRTTDFNNHIKSVVQANSSRIALADINAEFTKVVNGTVRIVDGIPVNATFAPPFGLFSEDGVHPNNRGSAYIAKIFIQAINAAFGSTVPLPSIAEYNSTKLPVSPQ